MIDYSESMLSLKRNLQDAYELMLKGQQEQAANILRAMSEGAEMLSVWIKQNMPNDRNK